MSDQEKSQTQAPIVGVVMGSNSDWDVMSFAAQILTEFGIPHERQVLSAHRMPDEMFAYAQSAQSRGLKAIIAGAGGAAHRAERLAPLEPPAAAGPRRCGGSDAGGTGPLQLGEGP